MVLLYTLKIISVNIAIVTLKKVLQYTIIVLKYRIIVYNYST